MNRYSNQYTKYQTYPVFIAMLKKSLKQCSSFRNTFSASSFFEILNHGIEKYIKISLKKSHLVTYAFSSKRWKLKGKIKLISKLMASFQMFLGKKEGKKTSNCGQSASCYFEHCVEQ